MSDNDRHYGVEAVRVALSAIIVAHHAGMPYGPAGPWLFESPTRSPFLGAFFAVSEALVVPAFFTVSGYYAEKALVRQPRLTFVRRRLLRLGAPLGAMLAIVNPLYFYFSYHIHSGAADVGALSLTEFYRGHWLGLHRPPHFRWPGLRFPLFTKLHLWFIESLLAYSLAFAALPRGSEAVEENKGKCEDAEGQSADLVDCALPATATDEQSAEDDPFLLRALLYTAVVSGLTFAVRTRYPINAVLPLRCTYVKPARQVQYIGAFALGVWAARQNVPLVRSPALENRLVLASGASLLGLLYGLSRVQDNAALVQRLIGGWHAESLLYILVETGTSLVTTVAAVSYAERRCNKQPRSSDGNTNNNNNRKGQIGRWLTGELARGAYGVYILHYFVITMLQTGLERWRPLWPPLLKWSAVTVLGLPLSYAVSHTVRRLPGVAEVL